MFSDLPPDLALHILAYLAIPDILSIRATCKSLWSATYERSPWLATFNKLCRDYGIIEGTYDVSSMAQAELERASMQSRLLLRRITDCAKSTNNIQPRRIHILNKLLLKESFPEMFSRSTHTRETNGFSTFLLIPGARFLVTNYKQRLIALWDLDRAFTTSCGPEESKFLPSSIAALLPIDPDATEDLDDWTVDLEAACVGLDGKTLRVVLHVYKEFEPGEYQDSEVRLYEIRPFDSQPTFELLYSRPLFARVLEFDEERIAMVAWTLPWEKDSIVIWDIGLNSSVTWDAEDHSDIITRIALTGSCVMTVHDWDMKHIKVYTIPQSSFAPDSHITVESSTIPHAGFDLTTTDVGSWSSSGTIHVTQPRRARQATDPIVMLKRERSFAEDQETRIRTFTILPPSGILSELRLCQVPSLITSVTGNDLHGWRTLGGGDFIDEGYSTTLWSENIGDKSLVHISVARKPLGAELWNSTSGVLESRRGVMIAEFEDLVIDSLGFCPLSARLLMLDFRGDLRILQY